MIPISKYFTNRIKSCREKLLSFILLFQLVLFQSCTYHDLAPSPAPCNCNTPITKPFQSIPGIMVNTTNGFAFLSATEGFYLACTDMDTTLLKDGLMVIFTGRLKTTCPRPEDASKEEKISFVQIDQWQVSQDSLFNSGPISIQVIRSEDYGYAPGFGYRIATSDGFKILQATIPVEGGNQVFKTPTDAFKVAVLVAYKINLKIGLPSLTQEDLYFLKIR